MSKHEPNAKLIKDEFRAIGWKASWTRRKNTVYLTLELADKEDIDNVFTSEMQHVVRRFYPNAMLTSGDFGGGTFKVRELPSEIVPDPKRELKPPVLSLYWSTPQAERNKIIATATELRDTLVKGGMKALDATRAIENLFSVGYQHGYDESTFDHFAE